MCLFLYKSQISRWLLVHLLRVVLHVTCLLARLSAQAACLEHCPQLAACRHICMALFWLGHCQDSSSLTGQPGHRSVSHLGFGFVLSIGGNSYLLHGVQKETLPISLRDHCIEIYTAYIRIWLGTKLTICSTITVLCHMVLLCTTIIVKTSWHCHSLVND